MKVIIVGGVAAGASAAARARRLDENAEIILLEKGEFISYANCGLPYHLGGVIPGRDDLLVMPPERFAAWFDVKVRTGSEVVRIDRERKVLHIRHRDREYSENYDKLLLATGAVSDRKTGLYLPALRGILTAGLGCRMSAEPTT